MRTLALLGVGLPTTATKRFFRSTSKEKEPSGPVRPVDLKTPIIEQSESGAAPHSATQVSAPNRTVWASADEAMHSPITRTQLPMHRIEATDSPVLGPWSSSRPGRNICPRDGKPDWSWSEQSGRSRPRSRRLCRPSDPYVRGFRLDAGRLGFLGLPATVLPACFLVELADDRDRCALVGEK